MVWRRVNQRTSRNPKRRSPKADERKPCSVANFLCHIIILFRSMQAVKNVFNPDFGANLGLVNCGILYNRRLVIWAQLFESRLALNPGFFFWRSKAFCRVIFSVIFRASNHQLVDKKNYNWNAFLAFKSEFKSRTNPGLS